MAKSFGETLANQIDDHGIKRAWLADRCGVSRVTVSRWLAGKRTPHVGRLEDLREHLQLSAAEWKALQAAYNRGM
jgi:transcriptional regulator with XRE-family HTH domain